jgi:uncharacterized protein
MLMSLAQRVNQTQLQEKDPDAENLLGRELGANSDALYILAQTVLVQNIALEQAKAQLGQLQQQLQQGKQQPAHATSFLGGLFGRHDSDPQPQQQAPPPTLQGQAPPHQPVPPYQPVPQYQQPQYQQSAQPQYYPPPGQPQYAPAGQPSFLRGAMQTAAGVAAGALAFEGFESILHGFGHGGGYGGGYGGFGGGMAGMGMGPGMGLGGGFERPMEETVVNNYYDSPGGGMGGGEHRFDKGGNERFTDTPNQGGQQSGGPYNMSDASYSTQGNDDAGQSGYDQNLADDSSAYDTSADDVQIDDSGSGFDDRGGFDNSGGDSL